MLNKESVENEAAGLKSIDLSSPDIRTSRSSVQPLKSHYTQNILNYAKKYNIMDVKKQKEIF